MKKVLFLLFTVLAFMSCSSDNDNDAIGTLNGTTWISPDDGDGIRTLIFASNTYTYKVEYAGEVQTSSGSYTYNPPKVMMKEGANTLSATISDTKLTTDPTKDGDYIVYYKK